MKKILLNESEKKQILSEREQAIINSFQETLNRIEESRLGNMARGLAAGAMLGLGGQQAQAQEPPVKPQTSMYGSPEVRAAKQAQRMANRKANEDKLIKGAIMANLYQPIDDNEYNIGINDEENNALEFKDIAFSMLPDGTKVKVNLKKYRKLLEKRKTEPDTDRYGGTLNVGDENWAEKAGKCQAGKCKVNNAEKGGETKYK